MTQPIMIPEWLAERLRAEGVTPERVGARVYPTVPAVDIDVDQVGRDYLRLTSARHALPASDHTAADNSDTSRSANNSMPPA